MGELRGGSGRITHLCPPVVRSFILSWPLLVVLASLCIILVAFAFPMCFLDWDYWSLRERYASHCVCHFGRNLEQRQNFVRRRGTIQAFGCGNDGDGWLEVVLEFCYPYRHLIWKEPEPSVVPSLTLLLAPRPQLTGLSISPSD